MESYRTEEEQVEALRKWWDDNGRSTVAAVIVALGIGFGWQGWQQYQQGKVEAASDGYQALLQAMSQLPPGADQADVIAQARTLREEHSRSTYAQFAALHLARLAVERGDLPEAEAQLRWALERADSGSDVAQLAQLRLARVQASAGDTDGALAILAGDPGNYAASWAIARGDVLMMAGRNDEARAAYESALLLGAGEGEQVNLPLVRQKLQALSPVAPRPLQAAAGAEGEADAQ